MKREWKRMFKMIRKLNRETNKVLAALGKH
jgi:hypothetical protein